jgi:hypothetical protein
LLVALTETEDEEPGGGDTNVIRLPQAEVGRIIELPVLGPPEAA